MFEKHLWKSDILSKDASQRHFANKNQLPGFYIGGTLVENELKEKKPSKITYFECKFNANIL